MSGYGLLDFRRCVACQTYSLMVGSKPCCASSHVLAVHTCCQIHVDLMYGHEPHAGMKVRSVTGCTLTVMRPCLCCCTCLPYLCTNNSCNCRSQTSSLGGGPTKDLREGLADSGQLQNLFTSSKGLSNNLGLRCSDKAHRCRPAETCIMQQ